MKHFKTKYLPIIIITFISSSGIAFADTPTPTVTGYWLLTKVIESNNVIEPFVSVDFAKDGKFSSMGIPAGTWQFERKSKILTVTSRLFKKLNGNNRVLKLGKNELILDNSGAKMFFGKLDEEKTALENADSGLIGTWISGENSNSGLVRLLIFEKPDNLLEIKKGPGVESRVTGTWISRKEENTLYLLGRFENIRGRNRVLGISKDKFTLVNSGNTYSFKKAKQNLKKIQKLKFTEDDFYDKNGDYKYENDMEKLPWQDPCRMIEYLKKIHRLKYRFSTLINGTEVFLSKTLTANVETDSKNETVNIDYIFNGYDRKNLPEDTELPFNMIRPCTNINFLYPLKENVFRVTGKETITTPAGEFHCTVIETVDDFGIPEKLWMIDSKPDVYAKIIIDDNSKDFPHYSVFELQKIE